MKVPIEVEDLMVLLAAAKVVRKALEEAGGDGAPLDRAVENIARTVMEPTIEEVFPPGLFSDN